jgi:hypothetical protein
MPDAPAPRVMPLAPTTDVDLARRWAEVATGFYKELPQLRTTLEEVHGLASSANKQAADALSLASATKDKVDDLHFFLLSPKPPKEGARRDRDRKTERVERVVLERARQIVIESIPPGPIKDAEGRYTIGRQTDTGSYKLTSSELDGLLVERDAMKALKREKFVISKVAGIFWLLVTAAVFVIAGLTARVLFAEAVRHPEAGKLEKP